MIEYSRCIINCCGSILRRLREMCKPIDNSLDPSHRWSHVMMAFFAYAPIKSSLTQSFMNASTSETGNCINAAIECNHESMQ